MRYLCLVTLKCLVFYESVLQVLAGGAQIRPGMTMIRTPIQQSGQMGKTIIRTPIVVQQGNGSRSVWVFSLSAVFTQVLAQLYIFYIFSPLGQGGQQVVTQIIRGQAVSTGISATNPVSTVTGQGVASPNTAGQAAGQTPPGTPRAQSQGQVKLSLAQFTQLTQVCEGDSMKMCVCVGLHLWQMTLKTYPSPAKTKLRLQKAEHFLLETKAQNRNFFSYTKNCF